ncbi:MAG: hypothetical protein COA78_29640 [Blastopirellula sp.]|nr:MAG: hypothetical protein COA78_29640 [Blastopirellula sp.]
MKYLLISALMASLVATTFQPVVAVEETLGQLSLKSFDKRPRGLAVEQKIRNENPSFIVRVDVDHDDNVYVDRDLMYVDVVSEKDGYLYLFYVQADEKILCVFPNKIQKNNAIQAHCKTTVPAETADFNLRVGAPFGEERLVAIVSLAPLSPKDFGVKSLTNLHATPIQKIDLFKAIDVELKEKPNEWAEHHVSITTHARPQQPIQQQHRLGLFVGIDRYADPGVTELSACEQDAKQLAKFMLKKGNLDAAIVLTNEDATLSKIRSAFSQLVANSKPQDEVFIYWSGHGSQIADDNGDERDGEDELLIPYDFDGSSLSSIKNSILIDDTFGRWIQELDKRKVVVIIDACHAGGQATGKSVEQNKNNFDFYLSENCRTKDIGQRDAALLLSSQASETSKVHRNGKISVMTHFLLEKLESDQGVTLETAFEYLKPRVIKYVEENYKNGCQNPVLSNSLGTVYLRP